jgi:hypothetical protein
MRMSQQKRLIAEAELGILGEILRLHEWQCGSCACGDQLIDSYAQWIGHVSDAYAATEPEWEQPQ